MNKNSLKEQAKQKAKKTTKAIKEATNQAQNSSLWKETKKVAKKTANIVGSHLAVTKASITLSNEEAELMEKLKNNLNKKGIYPSKSEILRAGLWSLRNKNDEELEEVVKDLFKVKQARVL